MYSIKVSALPKTLTDHFQINLATVGDHPQVKNAGSAEKLFIALGATHLKSTKSSKFYTTNKEYIEMFSTNETLKGAKAKNDWANAKWEEHTREFPNGAPQDL